MACASPRKIQNLLTEQIKKINTQPSHKASYISIFLLAIYSILHLWVLGYQINLIGIFGNIAVLYLLLAHSNKVFKIFYFVNTIIATIYIPLVERYGFPNEGQFFALKETNLSETINFLQNISNTTYLKMFCVFITSLVLFFLINKIKKSQDLIQSSPKQRLFIEWLLVIVCITQNLSKALPDPAETVSFKHFSVSVISFPLLLVERMMVASSQLNTIKSNLADPDWIVQSVKPKAKNYVLIIGESMRKDYMSLYGYSLKSTPFLDKRANIVFNNYISAAPATFFSLQRSLYWYQASDTNLNNNIITLAKKAGFSTAWLSNQGVLDSSNLNSSQMALQADYNFFTSSSFGLNEITKKDDFKLIPEFKKVIEKTPNNKPSLTVVHILGSHMAFCNRAEPEFHLKPEFKEFDCYISSIKKTDKFIQELIQILDAKKEPWSILYFSDHGLATFKNTLIHGSDVYSAYQVPLVVINSSDNSQKRIQATRSGFNLINGIAQWMGIKEKNLKKYGDFFGKENDAPIKVYNTTENVYFKDLHADPAKNFTPETDEANQSN